MNKEEFISHVHGLSTQGDFIENEHLLNIFPKFQYTDFIKCLNMGLDIRTAFDVVNILFDISRLTLLTTEEAFRLIHKYRIIINLLDLCRMEDKLTTNTPSS